MNQSQLHSHYWAALPRVIACLLGRCAANYSLPGRCAANYSLLGRRATIYCMLLGRCAAIYCMLTGPLCRDLLTTGPLCHDLLHAYWATGPRYIPSIYRATVPAIFTVLQLFPFPRVLWDGLSFQSSLTNEQ